MYVPQAQVPDALNALNVRMTPMAWVVRTRVEPDVAERADPGAAAAGDRAAGVGRPLDGRSGLAIDVAAALQHVLMTVFGGVGAAARGDRHLRPDGVFGAAAHAGDRHPAGARRGGASGAEDGRVPGHARWRWSASSSAWLRRSALARVIASLLFGVQARDPLVFVAMPLVLTLVALLAVWLPARRASRSIHSRRFAPSRLSCRSCSSICHSRSHQHATARSHGHATDTSHRPASVRSHQHARARSHPSISSAINAHAAICCASITMAACA